MGFIALFNAIQIDPLNVCVCSREQECLSPSYLLNVYKNRESMLLVFQEEEKTLSSIGYPTS